MHESTRMSKREETRKELLPSRLSAVLDATRTPLAVKLLVDTETQTQAAERERVLYDLMVALLDARFISSPRAFEAPITRSILERSDEDAIRADWLIVGRSLGDAMDRFEDEQKQSPKTQVPVEVEEA